MEPISKKFGCIFASFILIAVLIIVLNDVDTVEGGFHKRRLLGSLEYCKDKWRSCMKRVRIETEVTCNLRINRKFMCQTKFTKDSITE